MKKPSVNKVLLNQTLAGRAVFWGRQRSLFFEWKYLEIEGRGWHDAGVVCRVL